MRVGAPIVLALMLSTSCQTSELAFTKDNRLTFNSPEPRQRVSAPFTVSWSMRDFSAVGLDGTAERDRGAFVVFIDRAPMPVGKDLKWLARGDSSCAQDARCPDVGYLARLGIFVTINNAITVPVLPAQTDGVGDEQHHVTVVLVDGRGRRIGESAWHRAFTSRRLSR